MAVLVFSLLAVEESLATSTVRFVAGEDAYVIYGSPYSDDNYGSDSRLAVGIWDDGGTKRALRSFIYFPLTSLPSNAIITKAYLRLRIIDRQQFSVGETKTFYVYRVFGSWTESTLTWENQPGHTTLITSFYVKDTTTIPTYIYLTVTDAVKKWYGQDGSWANQGLVIMGDSKVGYIQFCSSEYSNNDYKPTLIIYYALLTASVTPTSASIEQGGSKNFQVQVEASGYTGSVSLSVTGLPSGATYSFAPNSGSPPFSSVLTITTSSSTPPGTYNVYVVAKAGNVQYKKKITLTVTSAGDFSLSFNPPTIIVSQGGSGSSTLVATFTGGFTGPIVLSVQSKPSGFTVDIAPSGNTATVTVSVDASVGPGSYSVVIRGTGAGKTHTATLTVQVQATGFSLSVNPLTITVKQGETGSSSLTISPIGSFTGTVSLEVESAPPGFDVQINPTTATPGSTVLVTVSVATDVAPGSYSVVLRGTSDGKEATATLNVVVEEQPFDYSLQAAPNTLSVNAGETASVTITATLTSGSPQALTLSLSGLPSGTSYNFNPPTITPTGSSTLTINTTGLAGGYSVVVTASGGGVVKQVTVNLNIETFDFTLKVEPESIEMKQGESATVAVTVTKVSGAAKKVKLSLMGLPAEASYSFNPEEITPTGTSILTIDAGSAKGTFTLIIKAKGDGKEKSAVLSLKIEEKRCVIATATYGSEVSDEVQFLRNFRDNIVLRSYAGRRFYVAFDAFYYSWSPPVAQYISSHPWLKPPVRFLLYPLLTSLLLASYVSIPLVSLNAELGVYVAGTITSILIGILYFTPLLLLGMYIAGRKGRLEVDYRVYRVVVALPIMLLVMAGVVQILRVDSALTIVTSAYVLSVIAISSLVAAKALYRVSSVLK